MSDKDYLDNQQKKAAKHFKPMRNDYEWEKAMGLLASATTREEELFYIKMINKLNLDRRKK